MGSGRKRTDVVVPMVFGAGNGIFKPVGRLSCRRRVSYKASTLKRLRGLFC